LISFFTKPKPESELVGLVYGMSPVPQGDPVSWYKRPAVLAGMILAITVVANIVFW
jgi:SSS family solute:Na+ symporter